MGKRKNLATHDPTKPKGKITAYAYFIRHKHEQKNGDLANLPFSEFSKKCSNEWKDMTDDGRAPFIKMASEDRDRFCEEMKVWTANGGKAKAKAEKKAKKDVNEPKRPRTAFFLFSAENREKIKTAHPEFKVTDVARELGKMWREVDEETKASFEKLSQEAKDKYSIEITAYRTEKKEREVKEAAEQRAKAAEEQRVEKERQKILDQQRKQEEIRIKQEAKAEAQKLKLEAKQNKINMKNNKKNQGQGQNGQNQNQNQLQNQNGQNIIINGDPNQNGIQNRNVESLSIGINGHNSNNINYVNSNFGSTDNGIGSSNSGSTTSNNLPNGQNIVNGISINGLDGLNKDQQQRLLQGIQGIANQQNVSNVTQQHSANSQQTQIVNGQKIQVLQQHPNGQLISNNNQIIQLQNHNEQDSATQQALQNGGQVIQQSNGQQIIIMRNAGAGQQNGQTSLSGQNGQTLLQTQTQPQNVYQQQQPQQTIQNVNNFTAQTNQGTLQNIRLPNGQQVRVIQQLPSNNLQNVLPQNTHQQIYASPPSTSNNQSPNTNSGGGIQYIQANGQPAQIYIQNGQQVSNDGGNNSIYTSLANGQNVQNGGQQYYYQQQ